jgi:AraC-like DNA-binding protein
MNATGSAVAYRDIDELQAALSGALVPLRVKARADSQFRVDLAHTRIGPVVAARVRGSAHTVSREASQIASTDPDLVVVTLHRSRSARVAQDDRCARVSPGDLVALDTTRAFQLAVAECCDVVVLGLPRGMLGSHADRIARSTAVPVRSDTAVRTLISAFLTGLGDNTQHLSTTNIHLAEAVASLLIAALAGTTPQHVEVASTLTDRILAATLADLGDPALCAAAMARRHGISPRHLHNLLSQRGHTFAAWARQQRLRRIHHDLCDPSLAGRTAAAIAARWGIHDARHLGRALRREYGQTAAEIRSTGTSQTWAGRPPPETSCQAATDFVT